MWIDTKNKLSKSIEAAMFNFIVENKNENDRAVTSTYMNIVKQACSHVGVSKAILNGEKPKNKSSYLVSDLIQTSFRYFICGYRNQILWMQGIAPEESYMRRQSRLRFSVLSLMEKYVLKRCKNPARFIFEFRVSRVGFFVFLSPKHAVSFIC